MIRPNQVFVGLTEIITICWQLLPVLPQLLPAPHHFM